MSEPQTRPTEELINTPSSEHRVSEVDQQATAAPELTGPLKTLKDAFPDLDLDIIQTILVSQDNNVDAAFEVLLGMSDPSYKPEPEQLEGLSRMQQDEAYARQLSREAYSQPPQNNNNNQSNEPLFNFQEELPVIKEKVIEAGIAAKNKIVNLYNQFMEATAESQQQQQQQQQQQASTRQSNNLENSMNNLSLSNNQNASMDLYGGEGRIPTRSHYEQPSVQKPVTTSTSKEQLLSDEEFARRLAREDSELDPPNTRHHEVANQAQKPAGILSTQHDSDQTEVTLSAVTRDTTPGYTRSQEVEHDDLDDLFNKPDDEEEIGKTKK